MMHFSKQSLKVSRRIVHAALAMVVFIWLGPVRAGELDPKALGFKMPSQINWVEAADGSASAVVHGDPDKPGLYILLVKWHAHHMSHPHYHPNDRLVTVLSGTWWIGTGPKFQPDSTVPLPPGSFVQHFGKQIHYDGAKDGDAILEIVGEGPATMIPAETK